MSTAARRPRERHGEHGKVTTRLYGIWKCVLRRGGRVAQRSFSRCRSYKYYSGRGITVCEAWGNSFIAFRDWARSHGYDDTLTIDRIDRNGNYTPENCQWIPPGENSRKANYYRWHVKPFETA